MSQEIIYTSAPKGLKPGSSGFCTVISSEGMAPNLASRLESHGGYRHAFGVGDAKRDQNPVNWAYTTMRIAGSVFHVISRVSDAGLDHSGRSNKLAHHIALDPFELPEVGPARTLQARGTICTEWDGTVELRPRRKLPPISVPKDYQAKTWGALTGDPGWAGVVAERLLASSTATVSVIFPLGADTISLVNEVLDLIPPGKPRWEISFSTYFTELSPGTDCRLRFVLNDTAEATALRKHPHAAAIDLCQPLPPAKGGKLYQCAHDGVLPVFEMPEKADERAAAGIRKQQRRAANVTETTNDSWDRDEDYERAEPGQPRRRKKTNTTRSRLIWIGGSVAAVLLACGAIWMVLNAQKANAELAANSSSQISNLDALSSRPANDPRVRRERSKPDIEQDDTESKPVNSDEHTKKSPDPKTDSNALANVAAKPTEVIKPPPMPKEKVDPFKDLPPDPLDIRMALLELPKPDASAAVDGWTIPVVDPKSLKLELLGNTVFEEAYKYALTQAAGEKGEVWKLTFSLNADNVIELGEFQFQTGDSSGKLTFRWLDDARRELDSAEVVKFLCIGMSSDRFSRLCRLGTIKVKPPLSCEFPDLKKNVTESSTFPLDPFLVKRLKAKESQLEIDLDLFGLKDFLPESPFVMRSVKTGDTQTIKLSIANRLQGKPELEPFKGDPNLAYLEIVPQLTDVEFGIKIEAFATLPVFKEGEFSRGRLDGMPIPDRSPIPLASSQLQPRLNKVKAELVQKEINKHIEDEVKRAARKYPSLNNPQMNPNQGEKQAFEKEKSDIQNRYSSYLARHKPETLMTLWKLLSGGPSKDASEFRESSDFQSSIYGGIDSAKVGARIYYPCQFKDVPYSIIVFQASKASK